MNDCQWRGDDSVSQQNPAYGLLVPNTGLGRCLRLSFLNAVDRLEKMADDGCPQKDSCPMYPLLTLSGTLDQWKAKYCVGDFSACARYKRAERGAPVPAQLLPNGKLLGRS